MRCVSQAWVLNQRQAVSDPGVLIGELESREEDTPPIFHTLNFDNTTNKNVVEARIISEFDYSRATMPFGTSKLKVENAVPDGNSNYNFCSLTSLARVADNPGSLELRLGTNHTGGGVETIPAAYHVLDDVQVSEDDLYVTFDAASFMSVLDADIFYGGRVDASGNGIPASTLFEEILESARLYDRGWWNYVMGDNDCKASTTQPIKSVDGFDYYLIDSAFDSVMVYLPIPPVSHREALTMLAAYAGAYLVERPDGGLHITTDHEYICVEDVS